MTTLEVIDTAVKVGLGALVAALSGFWLESYRRRADKRAQEQERFRDAIQMPVVNFVDEMLRLMSKAYWDYTDRKGRSFGAALEDFRE